MITVYLIGIFVVICILMHNQYEFSNAEVLFLAVIWPIALVFSLCAVIITAVLEYSKGVQLPDTLEDIFDSLRDELK